MSTSLELRLYRKGGLSQDAKIVLSWKVRSCPRKNIDAFANSQTRPTQK